MGQSFILFFECLTFGSQEDTDNFLSTALEGYKRCLIIGEKYDVRAVWNTNSIVDFNVYAWHLSF